MKRLPPGWTASGWPFARMYAEEDEWPEDHSGIWHVTTAAPKVLEAGRLMSRQQLGKTQGLGGGVHGVAPHLVSVVTRPESALRLARAMQIAALATKDRVPAWVVAWEAMVWSGWFDLVDKAHDVAWELEERGGDEWGVDLADDIAAAEKCMLKFWGHAIPGCREEARSAGRGLDKRWSRTAGYGRTRYDLLVNVEACAVSIREDLHLRDGTATDDILAPVGFTSAWTDVDPRHVRVVRLAAREGSTTDYEPREAELRFDPNDLVMLGLESPRGLERLATK